MKRFENKKYYFYIIIAIILFGGIIYYQNSRIVHITDEDIALSGSPYVTPQLFGAVGDGVANDTKAIQAAIDYASNSQYNVVFIPKGVYSVRNLKLKKNVSLLGEGEESILLASPTCKTWDGILHCNNVSDFSIKNIVFDGNKPIVEGNDHKGVVNIWIKEATNFQIENCTFQNNWYAGVSIKNSSKILVSNNRFINLDCGVITTDKPSNDITITDNYFDGAEMSDPISIYALAEGYHNNVTITNNIIKNHTLGNGILLRAVKNVTVSNNTIDNCGTGIYCTYSQYNDIVYGVYNALIENNIITNSRYEGMTIQSLNDSTITNNKIENSKGYGIYTDNVNNCVISNNEIINNNANEMLFNGFAMTINGLKNSKVSNNMIVILDEKVNRYRSPIRVASGENNEFIDNDVTENINKENLYIEESKKAFNNVYAYD